MLRDELLVGAAVLIVAAIGWRHVRTRRARRTLDAALHDVDPLVRRVGVQVAGDGGLTTNAGRLLALSRTEQDPAVLADLVEVVVRNQWEPSDDARLVELRLWARNRLAGASATDQHDRPAHPFSTSTLTPAVLAQVQAAVEAAQAAARKATDAVAAVPLPGTPPAVLIAELVETAGDAALAAVEAAVLAQEWAASAEQSRHHAATPAPDDVTPLRLVRNAVDGDG